MSDQTPVPVHLVVGEDAALLSHATSKLVSELVGSERDLVLEEVGETGDLTGALRSVSLFSSSQVVLFRAKSLEEPRLAEVLEYLGAPEPTSTLVLSLLKAPPSLSKAVRAAGGVVSDAGSGSGRNRREVGAALLEDGPVSLDGRARTFLLERVGEDLGRVPAILDLLASTYGPGVRLSVEQVEPFVGSAGMVPLWDLSDAIDAGNAPAALRVLSRLLESKSPILVMSVLSSHFERMFRLSAAGITDEREGAEFLGMKGSTYPAKKAISTARRYGAALPGVMELVADASTDVRGGSALPPRLVLEVLVARLAARPR